MNGQYATLPVTGVPVKSSNSIDGWDSVLWKRRESSENRVAQTNSLNDPVFLTPRSPLSFATTSYIDRRLISVALPTFYSAQLYTA